MRGLLIAVVWVGLFASPTARAQDSDRKGLDFFEAKIRPLLVTHCYACHSTAAAAKQKLKGGLLLDSREGCRQGGESGPAVVPGKPGESLLISALNHDAFQMPPAGKLPDELIAHFVKWIEMGAPDPRDGKAAVAAAAIDIEAGREHWAFRPLIRPPLPVVKDLAWVRTPIDQFVRARQEQAGIAPNQLAGPRTLIRRATFDLLGLPPRPEDVERFVADSQADPGGAYRRLLDQLLESPHYGERWARHWLDVTRFAESHGYAFDGDRPNAWHYRDFVIRALNRDLPYDEFVRLQIAGDLLTEADVKTTGQAREAIDRIAATGFLVAGPFTTQQTQKERERSRYEQLDDMVSTLGTALLGLTVGCSRCHSHKFDPLPQSDYYRMVSCFAEVGFGDTGINEQPEAYAAAKQAYDTTHAPLVAELESYQGEREPERFQQWLQQADLAPADAGAPAALKLEPWQHAGPFPSASLAAAFAQAFAPESGVDLKATYLDGKLAWSARPEWQDGVVHNTLNGDNSANYLYRVIHSPQQQQLALSLGSDDAIKVWVNGKLQLANEVSRGAAANQEMLQVPVREGANELLIKIVNGGGPSGFYFAAEPRAARSLEAELAAWQHIGPFPAADFNVAFDKVFAPETEVDLQAAYDGGKLTWKAQAEWKDGVAHNTELTGNNCANYLYREITSPRPQAVSLSLGSDDGIKVWVNGREVLSKKVGRNVAAAGQETVTIQLAKGRNELLMKIVNGGGATGFYFQATAGNRPAELSQILKLAEGQRTPPQTEKLRQWYRGYDLQWLQLNARVKRHETQRPAPALTNVFAARVRGTTYQFGEDTYKVYHLLRGNADNKQDLANPGFLQVLMRTDQQEQAWLARPAETGQSEPLAGRVALANWLTDVDRGAGQLLARVMVNRLWHHHFGRGIVATPSDFGTRGERPSHPELLDWLASELVDGGWNLKRIHKLIMSSAVYLQAGEVTSSGNAKDPENLLLWRREARRLEAEVIRDSLLAVSGTLDRRQFGKGTLDERSNRRSIYFTVKRSQLIPLLQLFDAPGTMQGIGAREVSTVAPQALALLNSPAVRQFASTFAERVEAEVSSPATGPLIDRAYQIALGRPATADERAAMTAFLQSRSPFPGADPQTRRASLRELCHLLLCTNEFVYVD